MYVYVFIYCVTFAGCCSASWKDMLYLCGTLRHLLVCALATVVINYYYIWYTK